MVSSLALIFLETQLINSSELLSSQLTYGLLGILNIQMTYHLVIIKQCKKVCETNIVHGTAPEVVFKL
jgi:hypothetical protein